MKSEIQRKESIITYPLLMQSSGNDAVVLFTAYGVGTVVDRPDFATEKLGQYKEDWSMSFFHPLRPGSTVTLTA